MKGDKKKKHVHLFVFEKMSFRFVLSFFLFLIFKSYARLKVDEKINGI